MNTFARSTVLAALFAATGAALAASQDDHIDCRSIDVDRRIRGCTKIIQDRSESAESRSMAYHNRGVGYRLNAEFDRSIADLTEAIKLAPKNAFNYVSRGMTHDYKNDYDRAIADYSDAIRLEPIVAGGYAGRGRAYLHKGDHQRALADLTEALKRGPDVTAYLDRGLLFEKLGRREEAIADLRQTLIFDFPAAKAALKRLGATP